MTYLYISLLSMVTLDAPTRMKTFIDLHMKCMTGGGEEWMPDLFTTEDHTGNRLMFSLPAMWKFEDDANAYRLKMENPQHLVDGEPIINKAKEIGSKLRKARELAEEAFHLHIQLMNHGVDTHAYDPKVFDPLWRK